MKKFLSFFLLCIPLLGFAQKDVTFIIDMRDYTGSYTTVHLNGDFNSWCGTCNPMADPEGDSIWTVTLPLTSDSIEYKFTLDGWTGQESLTSGTACTKTTGAFTNRFAHLMNDTILPGVAWESCVAKTGQVYLTMQVNMEFQTVDSTGVFLGGGSGFGTPGQNEMYPIGDSVYSITLPRDTGFFSYFTFMNGNCPSWGCKENLAGKPCGDPSNYNDRSTGSALYSDFHLMTCFGECTTDGTCPSSPTAVDVTFQSDRSNSPSFTAAYISGTMNNWSGNTNQMTDIDGDGIYEVTLSLMPGSYEFKFTADNWVWQENFDPATADSVCTLTTGAFTNRFITIGHVDTILPVYCWEECTQCGTNSYVTMDCSDLFISEYAEGSSNNKYIELYNPSEQPISLSGYTLYLSGNGGSYTNTFTSNATIPANDVYFIANSSLDSATQSNADTSLSYPSVVHFNGDDAVILCNGLDTIDVIGVPGVDPGSSWQVGTGSTSNNTLVRNYGVKVGSTDWFIGSTQWEVYPSNTWNYANTHASSCLDTSSDVTFSVNMSQVNAAYSNVYVSGTFDNWAGTNNQLSDSDGDGIYEGTVNLSSGYYEYKFLYDSWNGQENFNSSTSDSVCTIVSGAYINRLITIGTSDTILPTVCWEECTACNTSVEVTFKVNMNDVTNTYTNVYVSGSFNSWSGNSNQMIDPDGDGIFETTIMLMPGPHEYKFTFDNWLGQEYFDPTLDSVCTLTTGIYTNRLANIGNSDTILPSVCWEECNACGAVAYDNWYVSKTGNDQNSGSSASPFLTIQTAVDSAAPGDVIYVSSGIYSSVEIKKNVTVIGTGLTKPVIDGGDSTRCIEIIDTKAKIQNLRLENGYAPQTYNWNRGACLYAQYDSVWVENCDFYAGYASGGGDYYGGGGLPIFINCRFIDNTTAGTQYLGSMFFVDNGQSANFYNCLIDAKGYQNIFEVGYTYRVYNSTIINLEGQLYRSPWQNHEFTFVNNIVTELGNTWEVFPDTSQGFWGNFEGEVVFKNNRLPELTNSYNYSQGGEVIVTFCDTNDVAFIDSANGNYMLDTSSSHMNIGNLGIEFYSDVNGVNRPDKNGRVDLGAFESDYYSWDSTIIDVVLESTPVQCYGLSNGTIIARALGGVPPYSFSIDGTNYTSDSIFSNLTSGIYTIDIIDQSNNSWQGQVELIQPDDNRVFITSVSDTISQGSSVVIKSNYGVDASIFNQVFNSYWSGNGQTDMPSFYYTVVPSDQQWISLERSYDDGCVFKDSIQFFVDSLLPVRSVNTTLFVDQIIGSNDNTGSASSPISSIQKAIEKAIPGDTIQISSGVYSSFYVDKSLFIRGSESDSTIISGNDSSRCVMILNHNGIQEFANLHFRNGYADAAGESFRGGAIWNWWSDTIRVTSSTFKNCVATQAADYVKGDSRKKVFINSKFLGNHTGVYTNVGFHEHKHTFINCLIDATTYEYAFLGGEYEIFNSTILGSSNRVFGDYNWIPKLDLRNSIVLQHPNPTNDYRTITTSETSANWDNYWSDSSFISNSILPDSIWTQSGNSNKWLIVGNGMQFRAPIFEDSPDGDYRLAEIDPGNNVGSFDIPLYSDMNGHPRPDNDGFIDIGAFERDSRLISQNTSRTCSAGDSVLLWTSPIDSLDTGVTTWSTGETTDSIYVNPLGTTTYSCRKTINGFTRFDTTSVVVGGGDIVYTDSVLCFGSDLTLSVTGSGSLNLPSDFTYVSTFNGKDIYLIQSQDTWENQRIRALQMGGDLVSITSQSKQSLIYSSLNSLSISWANAWIGLKQNPQSTSYSEPLGGWEWVNGEPLTYSHWRTGEPNNAGGTEGFGEMEWDSGWNDISNVSRRAIIEIPVNVWDPISWSTGDSGTSIMVSPLVDTSYYVTTSYAGVSCTDTAHIYVNDARITASSNVVCVGDSISLSIPEFSSSGQSKSILWSTGDTTSTIWVSQDSTTSYWVSVGLSDAGCSDTIEILTTIPVPQITSSFTTSNLGTGVDLSSTAATTYMWSDSTSNSSINVYPSVTTDYWVKVTDTNACVGYDTLRVEASDITFRVNMRTQIVDTAKGVHVAGNFQGWNASTTEMYDPDGDGIYEVTLGLVSGDTGIEFKYINGNSWLDGHDDNLDSCTNVTSSGDRAYTVPYSNDTLPLYHLSSCDEYMPIDPLIDSQAFICVGDTTFLDAGEGLTEILWNTGDTSRTIGAATPGWYWFTAKYPHKVRVYDSTYVNFYAYTDTSLAVGGPTSFCDGDSVVLSVSSDVIPSWNNGASLNVLPITTSGSYYATVLDTNGCSKNTDTIAVTVWQLPADSLVISSGLEICEGDSVIITAVTGYDNYQWSNSDTNFFIVVKQTGDYTVTIMEANGCVSESDTISVTVNTLPSDSIIVTGALEYCYGDSVTMTAAQFTGSFDWSNGDTTQSITVGSQGDYFVEIIDANGCYSISDTLSTTVKSLPITALTLSDSIACVGDSIIITAGAGHQYLWSNNSTSNEIVVTQSGVYFAILYGVNGCTVTSDLVTVQFVAPPAGINITGNDTINAIYQNQEEYWINSLNSGSVQWGVAGGNIVGLNTLDSVLVEWNQPATSNAEVFVTLSNTGCSVLDTLMLFHTSIGISEEEIRFLVWPNPTSTILNIESDNEITGLKVLDVVGKVVHYEVFDEALFEYQLDITKYSAGTYFIEAYEQSGVIRKQVEKL